MTEYLWIMTGGLVGMSLSALIKRNSRGTFFITVIGGVGLLFLSGYFLQASSPNIFQGIMIIAAMFCSFGALLANRQHRYT